MKNNMLDLKKVLNKLKNENEIFSSEAHFQLVLAMEIKNEYPNAKVSLEHVFRQKPNWHIDIVVNLDNEIYPIELKYKTKAIDYFNTKFKMKNQEARDAGRYDFLKDLMRIEELSGLDYKNDGVFGKGYVIFLTNDNLYWNTNYDSSKPTVDDEFRIHNKRELKSGIALKWKKETRTGKLISKGTTKSRTEVIKLKGDYECKWEEYCILPDIKKNGEFQYLLLEIK